MNVGLQLSHGSPSVRSAITSLKLGASSSSSILGRLQSLFRDMDNKKVPSRGAMNGFLGLACFKEFKEGENEDAAAFFLTLMVRAGKVDSSLSSSSPSLSALTPVNVVDQGAVDDAMEVIGQPKVFEDNFGGITESQLSQFDLIDSPR